jgi:hypothetical protein
LEVNVDKSKSCHTNKGKHNIKVTNETSEIMGTFTHLVMLYVKEPVVSINYIVTHFSLVYVCRFQECLNGSVVVAPLSYFINLFLLLTSREEKLD